MKKMYSSKTLQQLNKAIADINRQNIFPYGHPSKISKIHDVKLVAVKNALLGNSASLEAIRAIIKEAETLTGIKIPKAPNRNIRNLSVPELYELQMLPARYSVLAAEIVGCKPNAVRYFVKNQLAGKDAYASTEQTKEALYKIAEMNEEWELLYGASYILERLNTHPS